MFKNRDISKTALIEKKIFNRVLQQVDLSYRDLHEKYQDEFPEPINGIHYVPFANWFSRGGMKLRRIMSLLALIKHTIVIVPADATVSVTLKGKKSVNRIVTADTVTVFASNQNEDDIRVEALTPQAIEENTEAPFRKRRSITEKEKVREAEEASIVALLVSEDTSAGKSATQKIVEIESAATETQAAALAAAQVVTEKRAAVEKAIEERENAKNLSAQIRNEQFDISKDAKEKEALKREIKVVVKAAAPEIVKKRAAVRAISNKIASMKAAPSPATPEDIAIFERELSENESLLNELVSAIKSVAQKDLVQKISGEIQEAKTISAQKMADQRVAALEADKKVAIVKDLKAELRAAIQVATTKESAAKVAAARLTSMNEAIEQAKNPTQL